MGGAVDDPSWFWGAAKRRNQDTEDETELKWRSGLCFFPPVLPIWYMSRLAACLTNGQMRGHRGKPGFGQHTLARNEKSAKTTGWQRGVRAQLCSVCCCHCGGGWTRLGALASPEGLQVSPCKICLQGLWLDEGYTWARCRSLANFPRLRLELTLRSVLKSHPCPSPPNPKTQ